MTREKVAEGVRAGLVAEVGLIAHGRGEAFDYMLGERTHDFADDAARAAAALLLLAEQPVFSVNGNAAVLAADGVAALQDAVPLAVEVNLFHRTEERVHRLVKWLTDSGCHDVLGEHAEPMIPGLDHARARTTPEGVGGADVVIVPLEDGDRCEALVRMGKRVIVVELNPLTRTARTAHVTIVDNVTRALPRIVHHVRDLKDADPATLQGMVDAYDNAAILARARSALAEGALKGAEGR